MDEAAALGGPFVMSRRHKTFHVNIFLYSLKFSTGLSGPILLPHVPVSVARVFLVVGHVIHC